MAETSIACADKHYRSNKCKARTQIGRNTAFGNKRVDNGTDTIH